MKPNQPGPWLSNSKFGISDLGLVPPDCSGRASSAQSPIADRQSSIVDPPSPILRLHSIRTPHSALRNSARAFTLIEIMIVVGIIGIILAAGIPAMFRAMRRDALRQAANDIAEGCSYARAQAILVGAPSEFRIRAGDGDLSVPRGIAVNRGNSEPPSAGGGFQRRLDPDVAIELLYVNLKDYMNEPEARVHFYPNGTADDFAIVLSSKQGAFKIVTDIVTGLTDTQRLR